MHFSNFKKLGQPVSKTNKNFYNEKIWTDHCSLKTFFRQITINIFFAQNEKEVKNEDKGQERGVGWSRAIFFLLAGVNSLKKIHLAHFRFFQLPWSKMELQNENEMKCETTLRNNCSLYCKGKKPKVGEKKLGCLHHIIFKLTFSGWKRVLNLDR